MCNCTDLTPVEFYRQYHSNPINKFIHFICIPMIVVCFLNYLSLFKFALAYKDLPIIYGINLDIVALFIYCFYYNPFHWPINVSIIMICSYIGWYNMAMEFRKKYAEHWVGLTHIIFILAWILQFYGHYIEGNRPALTDSISQAFISAPAFAILEPMGLI
tara:strand:+ start:262 stop:741 length:480 start_codon:yes stop_codon:yes gene_type:complete